MSETAHRVSMRELEPGETLESYGFTPDDVLLFEDASYERNGRNQCLLRAWFLTEVNVDE